MWVSSLWTFRKQGGVPGEAEGFYPVQSGEAGQTGAFPAGLARLAAVGIGRLAAWRGCVSPASKRKAARLGSLAPQDGGGGLRLQTSIRPIWSRRPLDQLLPLDELGGKGGGFSAWIAKTVDLG